LQRLRAGLAVAGCRLVSWDESATRVQRSENWLEKIRSYVTGDRPYTAISSRVHPLFYN
jgi:hypothetical protein